MPNLDPQGIGSAMTGAFAQTLPMLMNLLGIILLCALILGIFYFLIIFIRYKYKVTIFVRGGAGKDENDHSIRLIRHTKATEVREKGVEKLSFWMSRVKIDPIPMKYIYPGNRIYLYQIGISEFIPVKFACANPEAYFNPLPYSIRRWQNLEIQEAYRDYQEQSFMSKYGQMLAMFGTILFCLVLVGAVIFMTYKYIGGQLGAAADAAKSLGDSFREGVTQRFGGG